MSVEMLSGRVTATKPNGLQIDGGRWFSFSKFGQGANVPRDAQVGEHVMLAVDSKEFIQSLTRGGDGPAERRSVYSEPEDQGPERQRLIVRQSCLSNATRLVAGKCLGDPELQGKTSIQQLLSLAERLEEWVFRE